MTEQVVLDDEGDYFEVEVPVVRCDSCGFQFTDQRAERLRHEGACRHEGLLTPAEIKEIRAGLQMTRSEFDAAFGIPPASMERWENGRLLQNRSMDSLLRALTNPITAARLDRRTKKLAEVVEDNVVKFPTLASANRLREASMLAETFELRANG
jgi:DNA-binding transcriptional regulator YiaG